MRPTSLPLIATSRNTSGSVAFARKAARRCASRCARSDCAAAKCARSCSVNSAPDVHGLPAISGAGAALGVSLGMCSTIALAWRTRLTMNHEVHPTLCGWRCKLPKARPAAPGARTPSGLARFRSRCFFSQHSPAWRSAAQPSVEAQYTHTLQPVVSWHARQQAAASGCARQSTDGRHADQRWERKQFTERSACGIAEGRRGGLLIVRRRHLASGS